MGGGQVGGGLPRTLPNRDRDGPQHPFGIAENLMVPEPQDSESLAGQPAVAGGVGLALQMLTAVEFDDDSALEADEVVDSRADGFLAPELAAEGMPAQVTPEEPLGGGHPGSEGTGALDEG
jgi:hypothetical protein